MKLILSVNQDFQTTQEIKKSKFITRVIPIQDVDEAETKIEEIQTLESKANHNCYAFILGDQQDIQRASDDGEPSGTAGVPILEVLKKENLTNVLVVVTRYFGGIKLGAGGLIRAYGSSASLGIQASQLVQLVDQEVLAITLDYQNHDQLQYFLNQHDYQILDTNYTTQVTTTISVNQNELYKIKQEITGLFSGNVSFKDDGTQRVLIPYKK